jgi:hypothetical protein
MFDKARGFVVWAGAIIIIVGLFLLFVFAGWPGTPDNCIFDTPNSCYCEAFNTADVLAHAPGVRQPVNTWFNLYAIFSSLLVAIGVHADRKEYGAGSAPNLLGSKTAVPDLYIFAVLFLGLGSMWFHGSLTKWGGILDGVSMFVFVAFLIFYTIRRIWQSGVFFWVGYLLTVTVFSIINGSGIVPPVVAIFTLVIAYLAVEIYIWVRTGKVMQGTLKTQLLWVFAIISILTATFFWWASQTGRFLCSPTSLFQPHGLLWHPLAGVTAVLLYFYWRAAKDPV